MIPLLRRTLPPAAAVLGLLLIVGAVGAYPRPRAISPRWELEFEPGELRLYEDPAEGRFYWYFSYQVVNHTGNDQVWAPSFILYTDVGEILPSGRDVPSRVGQDLLNLLGNPLMENQNEIIGDIYHGREHAKDGLVVWPAEHLEVNELSLFVAGTSGETATVENPITGQPVTLRKTLQRNYLIPGEAPARGSKPIELVSQSWVMR